MAKRVAGVTEKLMECAKEEFLANGYENVSLRIIAEKAGSSKGAIYIRYPDKESLYSNDGFPKVVDYLYDHFDEFKLLLTSGENSVYQEFIHRVVELDTECTAKYIEASGNDAITSGRLTPELNHLLSSAFYTGMFEVIIHDMPKAQALEHIRKMRRFYTAGWQTIFSTDGGDVV